MVLDEHRKTIDPLLTNIAKPFKHINPDVFSIIALICAGLGGFFFYQSSPEQELQNSYLFLAVLFVFLNGLFDALDGKIAKLSNRTSKRGDFIDHALDRYADVLIIGGLALSQWIRPSIGLLALIGVLLTSYMGTQAQAVGYQRVYAGLLGRADRLALLMIIPILQHITLSISIQLPYELTILEVMLLYFAIMGNITALQRFYQTLAWFKHLNGKKS
ncbi:MAG: CDP-alcohol phosphatidyltransferase family protein [Candidatus Thermoplasmatota archaeon]|nr:CDP-alcohol phosphatidyltransferase family protein [Candidatus Thermoplasmatota archaeon]MBU1940396.1 CDP-alcohol phosphatidyltransferase family protein [Candidatus Thermoplasmatota archaeon]